MSNIFDINSISFDPIDEESELIPLMTSDDEEAISKEKFPDSLPILPLRNTVLFPGVVIPITASRDKSVKLIKNANSGDKLIGVVSQKDSSVSDPKISDINKIGTVAKILRVPYVLHEQNSYPGLVTKMFSNKAKVVFLGFENAKNYLQKSKTIFSGNPILLTEKDDLQLEFNPSIRTILIFGGSQGSKFLNDKIKALIENNKLDFANIVWVVGKNNYDSLKHLSGKNISIMHYCNKMSSLYQKVDLVISRSGAMTISELVHFKNPYILVPFKFSAENHQYYNAKYLQDNLCSHLIEEESFDSKIFLEKVKNICLNDRILNSMIQNFQKISTPSTLDIISDFIVEEKYVI